MLTILGLAASIVTIRFAGPLREARVRAAIEQWRATDQVARLASRSGGVTVTLKKLANRTQISIQSDTGHILRRGLVDAPLSIEIVSLNGVATDELVFVPLGGIGEIGMNAGLYGFGTKKNRRWLLSEVNAWVLARSAAARKN